MYFELTTSKVFKNYSSKEYINDCCIGCDEILNQLKVEIASEMSIDKNSIEIYQEDWGWALEFLKNEITYLLAISNASELEDSESLFTIYTEAIRKEKKMFFNKKVTANIELNKFFKLVLNIAKRNGFKVN